MGVPAVVTLIGLVAVGVWFTQSLKDFQNFLKKSRSGYEALNAKYPLAANGQAATPERIEAYLRARRALMETITPSVETVARDLLQPDDFSPFKGFTLWRASADFLKAAAVRHQESLEREKMGLNEYLWIHGLMVREILHADQKDERRLALADAIGRMEGLKDIEVIAPIGDSSAEDYVRKLETRYAGKAAPDTRLVAAFDKPPTIGAVIDIIAADPGLNAPEKSAQLSPHASQ